MMLPKSPATTPPPPIAAPAPVPAPEPPRPDRWQEMSEARARCTRENLITRIICEQKVLFQYCNGYWGKVPQCQDSNIPEPGK